MAKTLNVTTDDREAGSPWLPTRKPHLVDFIRENAVYVSLVVVVAVLAIVLGDDGFVSRGNFFNVLRQAAPIIVMSGATVFVLTSGEIDLSFGSTVALAALVTAVVLRDSSAAVGIAAGLSTGVAVGLLNGLLTAVARIPSFLVTLATFIGIGGAARQLTGDQAVAIRNVTFHGMFASRVFDNISLVIVWAVAFVAVLAFVFHKTRYGAHVKAVGDDRNAAASAAIRITRVRISVFVLNGFAASLAGILYAAQLQGARYTLGSTDMLTVIAAVIIGGTSLFGGRGSMMGAVVGAILLAVLNNGLILYGLSVSGQQVALGIIIILAVLIGRERARG